MANSSPDLCLSYCKQILYAALLASVVRGAPLAHGLFSLDWLRGWRDFLLVVSLAVDIPGVDSQAWFTWTVSFGFLPRLH